MRFLTYATILLFVSPILLTFSHAPRVIHVYGEINRASAAQFLTDMKTASNGLSEGDTISIYIDSPGGSVIDGLTMIQAMKSVQAKGINVNTVCESFCGSMAAIMLEFGTKRLAADTSVIMFHRIFYGGDPSRVDVALLVLQHAFMEEMVQRVGVSEEVWYLVYKAIGEIWLSARDAQRANIIDDLVILDLDQIAIRLEL